jgi:hypothetical protein
MIKQALYMGPHHKPAAVYKSADETYMIPHALKNRQLTPSTVDILDTITASNKTKKH